jgi:arylsulfatase A-like enzyme
MKFVLYFLLVINLASCSLGRKNKSEVVQKQPNIIYIMTDDHAYQAISAYDTSLIETPNIDRLAHEGMLFNQAYVTNSICSPSRAVALTGKFSHLNGLKDNWDVFDSTQVTFPKILQNNGYETAVIGKWHLKSEPTGFDYWQVLPGQGHYYQPEFRTPEGMITEQGYVTDVVTDKTINWLSNLRDKSKPFMIMCHQKAPHREWLLAQRHLKELTSKVYPEPTSLFDDYKGRGTAAHTAEMRISEHMGLSSDNKIPFEIVEKLGFHEFLSWYELAYTNNLARLTAEELSNWEATCRSSFRLPC